MIAEIEVLLVCAFSSSCLTLKKLLDFDFLVLVSILGSDCVKICLPRVYNIGIGGVLEVKCFLRLSVVDKINNESPCFLLEYVETLL